MVDPYVYAETNLRNDGGNTYHKHEWDNSHNTIGCSHSIYNQCRVETMNTNTHIGLLGNQAFYSFETGFTANELMTTNCKYHMIITEPTLNNVNYTTIPDFIAQPMPNNALTVTQQIRTIKTQLGNRYTVMDNETT